MTSQRNINRYSRDQQVLHLCRFSPLLQTVQHNNMVHNVIPAKHISFTLLAYKVTPRDAAIVPYIKTLSALQICAQHFP
jgi:hypothetical protein